MRKTVRLIYRLYLEGLNTYQVADYLNGRGIAGPGKQWYNGTVHRILTSTTYVGERLWGKRRSTRDERGKVKLVATTSEDRRPIAVPAIIDHATFDAVKDRLAEGLAHNPRRSQYAYLLSGLVRCGRCGGIVYAGNGSPKYRYYRCAGKFFGDPSRCGAGGVRVQELEDVVWGDIVAWAMNPQPLLEKLAESMRAEEDQRAAIEVEQEQVARALLDKQAEEQSIVGLFRRKRISEKVMEHELDEIAGEVRALEQRRDALLLRLTEARQREQRLTGVEALLTTIRENLGTLTPERKQEIVRELVERVVLTVQPGRTPKQKRPKAEVIYRFELPDEEPSLTFDLARLAVADKMHDHAVPLRVTIEWELRSRG